MWLEEEDEKKKRSTSYEAPHYVIFAHLVLLHLP
jgi:hypothetical protein